MSEKVRLSLDVSEQLYKEIEHMAEVTGSTKADILRRALALAKVAVDEKQKGHKLGILDKDRKVLTEIIGL